jgi:hypothetical protein
MEINAGNFNYCCSLMKLIFLLSPKTTSSKILSPRVEERSLDKLESDSASSRKSQQSLPINSKVLGGASDLGAFLDQLSDDDEDGGSGKSDHLDGGLNAGKNVTLSKTKLDEDLGYYSDGFED